jgi:hypothetical protein
MTALRAGELEVALVRDRPPDQEFDAVLVVEEPMGVILATDRATALAEPGGVQLPRLTGLRWIGFPRSDSPAWYDQVTATLRWAVWLAASSRRDLGALIDALDLSSR